MNDNTLSNTEIVQSFTLAARSLRQDYAYAHEKISKLESQINDMQHALNKLTAQACMDILHAPTLTLDTNNVICLTYNLDNNDDIKTILFTGIITFGGRAEIDPGVHVNIYAHELVVSFQDNTLALAYIQEHDIAIAPNAIDALYKGASGIWSLAEQLAYTLDKKE